MTHKVASPADTASDVLGGLKTLDKRAAAQIRALMAARRLKTVDLGEVLGISQQSASRRVLGYGTFNLDQIEVIADWLGVEITDIITPAPPGTSYIP